MSIEYDHQAFEADLFVHFSIIIVLHCIKQIAEQNETNENTKTNQKKTKFKTKRKQKEKENTKQIRKN